MRRAVVARTAAATAARGATENQRAVRCADAPGVARGRDARAKPAAGASRGRLRAFPARRCREEAATMRVR
jgi:hypothetical protein